MLVIMLLAVWQLPQLKIDSDLLALFPTGQQPEAQGRAEELLSKKYEQQVLLLLAADDSSALRTHLPLIVDVLQACECIAWAGTQFKTENATDRLDAVYKNHANIVLTEPWRDRLLREPPEKIQQQRLREFVTSPGLLNEHILANDPLGSVQDFLRTLRSVPESVSFDEQGNPYIVIEKRHFYLLRVELQGSPFSIRTQAQFAQSLNAALKKVRELPGFRQLQTGAVFYTMDGTEQARTEISTVGVGSATGIVLLLLIVFRRVDIVLLAFAPIAVGVVAGLLVTQWAFGRVHLMALVFGAALVGVAIDYSLHFFTERLDSGPAWQAPKGAKRLFAPLALGLVSSCAGYLSFMASGFPGFMQIAVLSSTGLAAAFIFVMGWYPLLLARPVSTPMPRWLAVLVAKVIGGHSRFLANCQRPSVYFGGIVLVLGGISCWQVNDDIRAMQSMNPALQKAESTLREYMPGQPALQYLLVQANDINTLLRRGEQLQAELDALVVENKLGGYSLLSQWVPSLERQRDSARLWQQQVLDSGLLNRLYEKLGVKAQQAKAYTARWSSARNLPPEALLPILSEVPGAPGYFAMNDKHYSVVHLYAPVDAAAAASLAAQHAERQWVDPVARTSGLLQTYRERASVLLLVAYSVIFCLLLIRYRVLGAAKVIAPPALASVLTIAILLLSGQALSVFHVMALLLVLGIGVDYSLFWRESAGKSRATMLAIGLSTITTVLSFGLLALSSTTAIHNFGLVVLVGIFLVFLLAPLSVHRCDAGR
ncbi:MMPL family transporter [Gilvimarinus chinensis]|uniref:MMPL family transporter n=1 Tax=Gilvimarinus chinensis TaxID=396005 RepID=UPI0003A25556|nr:MMPL family transporter [Gilvimarinus chinensis]